MVAQLKQLYLLVVKNMKVQCRQDDTALAKLKWLLSPLARAIKATLTGHDYDPPSRPGNRKTKNERRNANSGKQKSHVFDFCVFPDFPLCISVVVVLAEEPIVGFSPPGRHIHTWLAPRPGNNPPQSIALEVGFLQNPKWHHKRGKMPPHKLRLWRSTKL